MTGAERIVDYRARLAAAGSIVPPEEAIKEIVAIGAATWSLPPRMGAQYRREALTTFWTVAAGLGDHPMWVLQIEKPLLLRLASPDLPWQVPEL